MSRILTGNRTGLTFANGSTVYFSFDCQSGYAEVGVESQHPSAIQLYDRNTSIGQKSYEDSKGMRAKRSMK